MVLSNNDGCVIARSNEAKALGIKMGDPFFKLRELIDRYGVAVRSSNFVLYGDMSARVMNILRLVRAGQRGLIPSTNRSSTFPEWTPTRSTGWVAVSSARSDNIRAFP
ncbi:MAG: hypothetical protein ACLR1G_04670 [Alistipes indistinctus]